MNSGFSQPAFFRRWSIAGLVLLVACLSGCDESVSYPAEMTYPGRQDPIVVESPGKELFYTDQPGRLTEHIAQIGISLEQGGPGGKALKPDDAPADKRAELKAELTKLFGTPAAPTVNVGEDADSKTIVQSLKLDDASLAEGSKAYRRHCVHCHGVAGDGRGPTGPWLSPHPRDYRLGAFKFLAVDPAKIPDNNSRKPRRDDLFRTLHVGIEGTSMPSFALLTTTQLDQLVSYVMHLSLRGEVEIETLKPLVNKADLLDADEDASPKGTVATHTKALLKLFLGRWAKVNEADSALLAPAYPYGNDKKALEESIARGYEIFTNSTAEDAPKVVKGAGCISCHQDFGRQVNFKYDQWGTLVRPANLTVGVYRGGRRPIDLYWRVRGGIIPSQMPLVELKKDDNGGADADNLDGNKYWDLVNFVQMLPYPAMLPDKIRAKVYPLADDGGTDSRHASR